MRLGDVLFGTELMAVAAAARRRVIVAWHRLTRALRGRRRPKRRLYRRRWKIYPTNVHMLSILLVIHLHAIDAKSSL